MASVFQAGYHTESSGTEIVEAIPPMAGAIARLKHLRYTSGATQHTITIMRCIGKTTSLAEAAAGQTTIDFSHTSPFKTPAGATEVLDSNDWCVYQTDAGVEGNDIATVTGDSVVFNNNLGARVSKGAVIWIFGEVGRATHVQLKPTVSTTTDYANLAIQAGIPADVDIYNQRSGVDDALLIVSDNITNVGSVEYAMGEFVSAAELSLN